LFSHATLATRESIHLTFVKENPKFIVDLAMEGLLVQKALDMVLE